MSFAKNLTSGGPFKFTGSKGFSIKKYAGTNFNKGIQAKRRKNNPMFSSMPENWNATPNHNLQASDADLEDRDENAAEFFKQYGIR